MFIVGGLSNEGGYHVLDRFRKKEQVVEIVIYPAVFP
jgi:hypothetical protein